MGEAAAELGRASEAIQSNLRQVQQNPQPKPKPDPVPNPHPRVRQVQQNPLEAVSLLGLDKSFVEAELKMIDSLRKGTAVTHHLEPSYFAAVKNGLDVARPIGVFYEAPLDVDDEGMTRDVE